MKVIMVDAAQDHRSGRLRREDRGPSPVALSGQRTPFGAPGDLARVILENGWQDSRLDRASTPRTKWESDSGFGQGTRNTPWQWRTTWGEASECKGLRRLQEVGAVARSRSRASSSPPGDSVVPIEADDIVLRCGADGQGARATTAAARRPRWRSRRATTGPTTTLEHRLRASPPWACCAAPATAPAADDLAPGRPPAWRQ